MNAPRFLVVKYVPDLHRFEPRNIGVIVWAACGVDARFMAEVDSSGDVDGRSVAGFVSSPSAYKQWVRFWRTQIAAEEIEPCYGGSPIKKASPGFVEELIRTGAGNFLVSDGGILLDEVTEGNLREVVNDIYERLVTPTASAATIAATTAEEIRDPALDEICDELIEKSSLVNDPNFKSSFVVACAIGTGGNLFENFEVSHAYESGSLKQLYQRVPISKQKKTLRKTIHDSAWMFEKITQNKIATYEQCACLVYASDEQKKDPYVAQSLSILSTVGRVVNVANHLEALDDFKRLAQVIH